MVHIFSPSDKNIRLETDRLVLEPMQEKFISQNYLQWLNDREICKYLESPIPYSEKELKTFVNSMIARKVYFWAITIKENNLHIGNIKIDPINQKHGLGEYGILMGDRNNLGKGYAKEASQAVISFCFEKLGLRKITLGVIEDNEAAVKLYKSLGFQVEGIYQMHGKYDGKYCNAIRMALFNMNDDEVQSFFLSNNS
ncbi:GNAT family N-acetyltransferase [Aquirufa salirivi]|uniref:GNAT family protein n=1 Tax=Aquirufa salirivi TaxID=3104729 RepID=A0ABW8RTK1_9BACT